MSRGFWINYYYPSFGHARKNRVDIMIPSDNKDARQGKRCLRFNHIVTEDEKELKILVRNDCYSIEDGVVKLPFGVNCENCVNYKYYLPT